MRQLTRDQRMALDHADGMTFSDCAAKYGIHASRCHQIYTKIVREFRLSYVKHLTGARLAAAMAESKKCRPEPNTPESFYHRLSFERARDEEERRIESLRQSNNF